MPIPKRSRPEEPVKLKVKKGDMVEVISGKDKGKRGEIITAYPKENKVMVRGANQFMKLDLNDGWAHPVFFKH